MLHPVEAWRKPGDSSPGVGIQGVYRPSATASNLEMPELGPLGVHADSLGGNRSRHPGKPLSMSSYEKVLVLRGQSGRSLKNLEAGMKEAPPTLRAVQERIAGLADPDQDNARYGRFAHPAFIHVNRFPELRTIQFRTFERESNFFGVAVY
jgi:hypothetical protein